MGLIGFVVGLIGFFLHQLIDLIADTKWSYARELIQTKSLFLTWLFVFGYSFVSACFVRVGWTFQWHFQLPTAMSLMDHSTKTA